MRDILFKAKTFNDKWVQGLLAHTDNKWYISNKEGMPFAFDVRPETIGQYTGLKDKNGIKIYEGDIVKFDEYKYEKLVQSIISEIKWCEELCSLSLVVSERQGTRGTLSHLLDYNKEVRVIGNIFDNPELLEQEENDGKISQKN